MPRGVSVKRSSARALRRNRYGQRADPAAGAVLVTGTSSGIGRAIAMDLAARGVTVFAGVRRAGDAPEVSQGSGQIHELILDVTNLRDIAEASDYVQRRVGNEGLRAIVNNAGIAVSGPLEFLEIGEMQRQFEVNLFGQLAVTQAFLELVRGHGDGRIIFMGSIGGRVAAPFVGPYAASKHALNGMAESMRRELHPWNVQVSVLSPGAVSTPIWDKARNSVGEMRREVSPRCAELYGDAPERMSRYIDAVTSGGSLETEAVVRAARLALYARRVRPVYLIGAEARVGVALLTLLPVRIFDALLARQTEGRPG
jgi:NAD(P)-dependent dehydrogenase (short-subunit alcohol dehydrogenase family)